MDTEDKKSKKLFRKKIIPIPNNSSNIKTNIKKLLIKDEEIVNNYLERLIFTSKISQQTQSQINDIYKLIDDDILNKI